mgnify:CR=1 FL=1
MRHPRTLFALLALAVLAAGCAGEGGLSATGESGASGATAFNPLAPPQTAPPGGREVIENPTKADVMLAGTAPEMAFGRADAPVTIVQYASLTCPHCRRFHKEIFPKLKRAYIDTGKVRYILRDFPIGKTSGAATIALRCAKPEKYLELYGTFLEQQPNWVSQEVHLDRIYKVAAQVGMTRQQFDACRENQAMIDGLDWVKQRGRLLGVIGTPNFFIETKLVKKVLSFEEISAMVDPLIAGQTTAAAGAPR